jgi:hypothetical protein
VSLRDLCEVCKNHYVRSCFERRFCKANHSKALCFEGDGEVDEAAEPQ